MRKWTPWTIALAAAAVAVTVTLWRQFDLKERTYVNYVAEMTGEAMLFLGEDPLAVRVDTQQIVRIVAAAADAGHYVTPESQYALAVQFQREGDNENAEALLHHIVAQRPEWSWPYALLGSIIGRGGPERLEEAEAVLRQAVALEPEWARPHNSLAVALRLMGRYDEAEEAAVRAIELAPRDIAAHNNYANLLLVLGRYDEAEVHYTFAVELEPYNPKPIYNLACLYSVMEREEEAIEALATAISLSDVMRGDAAVDPYLSNLHPLPAFQQLIFEGFDLPVDNGSLYTDENVEVSDSSDGF